MARFWNKYPYTDFHELNIGWCVDKITDFEARLTSVEEDVAALKVRATALEARMTTAEERIARHEQDIHGLSTTVGNLGTRVTTLETAEIQDAAMLEGVSSVNAGNASVTVNFSAAAYDDGEKTAGSDAAVIPAATDSAAGVMLPGEKQKLAPMSVNGNDVTFAGKVAGSAPSANNDFATKQYVDNLAITGSAAVTHDEYQLQSDHGTPTQGAHDNRIYRYGSVRVFVGSFSMLNVTSEISNGSAVVYLPLAAGDLPPTNTFQAWTHDFDMDYDFQITVSKTSEKLFVLNKSGRAITTEDSIFTTPVTVMWLVE